jgi:molybdopterin-guanine dinucleotide biosynthesis protein A
MRFDALILAGGKATRLGGVDKALIEIGSETLLDRTLSALRRAATVVVVGPRRRVSTLNVTWVLEEPAGAGPVHAIAAGLEAVTAEVVVVAAVDHPLISAHVVDRLLEGSNGREGAAVSDSEGHLQPLLSAYDTGVLRARLRKLGRTQDAAMHELVLGLDLAGVLDPGAAMDCDTWDDVAAARAVISGGDGDAG